MPSSFDARARRGEAVLAAPAPDAVARSGTPAAGIDDGAPPAVGRASAKTILFGEHAVVYGHPAIALPVRAIGVTASARRSSAPSTLRSSLYHGRLDAAPARLAPTVAAVEAALEAAGCAGAGVAVDVRSEIPAERGLGSSAAVAAAIVRAVGGAFGSHPDPDELHALIQIAERAAHGRPSGLDARSVVATGPVWFAGGNATALAVGGRMSFVLADSGVAGRTREAVGGVRRLRESRPQQVDAILERLGGLSALGRDALAAADAERVGAGMSEAHRLLGELGVGEPALDHLVAAAARGGALGAKLTGGGRGGCVVAVARDAAHADRLVADLRRAGAPAAWSTHLEASR